MKKALKIFGGVIAALVGLMLISPILLKGKAKDIAVDTINGMLNAEIFLDDVDISFFKNFFNSLRCFFKITDRFFICFYHCFSIISNSCH